MRASRRCWRSGRGQREELPHCHTLQRHTFLRCGTCLIWTFTVKMRWKCTRRETDVFTIYKTSDWGSPIPYPRMERLDGINHGFVDLRENFDQVDMVPEAIG